MSNLIIIFVSILLGVFLTTSCIDKYVEKYLNPKLELYPDNKSYKKRFDVLYTLYTCIWAIGYIFLLICGLAVMYRFALYAFFTA